MNGGFYMSNKASKDTNVLFTASREDNPNGKAINREYQDSVFRDLFKEKSNYYLCFSINACNCRILELYMVKA